MEIWIEFNDGKMRFSPDPAVVQLGTSVKWRFRGENLMSRSIRWTIYFPDGNPLISTGIHRGLSLSGRDIVTNTRLTRNGQHVGNSLRFKANQPGVFKYGVHVFDLNEEEALGDEDPVLIVH